MRVSKSRFFDSARSDSEETKKIKNGNLIPDSIIVETSKNVKKLGVEMIETGQESEKSLIESRVTSLLSKNLVQNHFDQNN